MVSKASISKWFKKFAANEYKGSSPLYDFLSRKIAKDDDILELCMHARKGQPIPNLLFGAVHYLLLKGSNHSLKEYYVSIVQEPKATEESFLPFKDFCRTYRDEMISILSTKLVQTNEVRRSGYLYPSFCYIYNIVKRPLSLIEIGTSAGLQLLWDQYSYSYGNPQVYGNQSSDVHITSTIKGENMPHLLEKSPPVKTKVGLDLHVSRLDHPEDYLWLKALIWPEHQERRQLFEQAAKTFIENPVKLIEGDGIALLEATAMEMPKDTAICIFHTHVANQIPNDQKLKLIEKIKHIGKKRDVFHLYNNMWDTKLHLDYILKGMEYHKTIGETDGHGSWFSWELD
ncbi:DUF2332 domain-containing protein [Cerasibacillus quisquiliarum]|uniref:DUF2332 domain-containing protein n=1 Tax=Cerasibacillus quisquiliarum TaxID=227865 RepID=UPI0011BE6C57|nr:DUF2332 domain-containing protein [Cerasibacillus quisquiliarum]